MNQVTAKDTEQDCNLCHHSSESWRDFSLWYRVMWWWMGKWHTNIQPTWKQMRTVVLELALCQTKLQLWIQHPAWLLGRKPAPDLTALLHFSTAGGLFKVVKCIHENWLFHFLFQQQRCKEASTQTRNGAVSQPGVSEHLTHALTGIQCSSCWGWVLLGTSSTFTYSVLWLCSAQWNKCFGKLAWRHLFCYPPSVICTSAVAPMLGESCSWFTKRVTQTPSLSALQANAWDRDVLGLREWLLPISWTNNAVPSLVMLLSMIQNEIAKILSMLCN